MPEHVEKLLSQCSGRSGQHASKLRISDHAHPQDPRDPQNIGIMENKMETTIMENQMEKKMEDEMETTMMENQLEMKTENELETVFIKGSKYTNNTYIGP